MLEAAKEVGAIDVWAREVGAREVGAKEVRRTFTLSKEAEVVSEFEVSVFEEVVV